MPKRTYEFTPEQASTIKLALIGWTSRCEAEAKQMEKWAEEYAAMGSEKTAAKCRANAKASRTFIDEARAVMVLI